MRLSAIFTFQNIFLFSAFHSVFRCPFPIKLCKNLCKITLKNPFYTVSDFPAFDYCPWQITLKKYMWHYATNPLFMHVCIPSNCVNPTFLQLFLLPLLLPVPWPAFPFLPSHHPISNVYKY